MRIILPLTIDPHADRERHVLMADFVNTTGDAVFDGTLKQALAVDLEQSPYLNIFRSRGFARR